MGKLGFGTQASRLRQTKRQTHCRGDKGKKIGFTVAFKHSYSFSLKIANR